MMEDTQRSKTDKPNVGKVFQYEASGCACADEVTLMSLLLVNYFDIMPSLTDRLGCVDT